MYKPNMTDEHFIAALKNADLEIRSYSPRGAMGKKCVAFDTEGSSIAALLNVVRASRDICRDESYLVDLIDALDTAHVDGLGHGSIVYFPAFSWPSE